MVLDRVSSCRMVSTGALVHLLCASLFLLITGLLVHKSVTHRHQWMHFDWGQN